MSLSPCHCHTVPPNICPASNCHQTCKYHILCLASRNNTSLPPISWPQVNKRNMWGVYSFKKILYVSLCPVQFSNLRLNVWFPHTMSCSLPTAEEKGWMEPLGKSTFPACEWPNLISIYFISYLGLNMGPNNLCCITHRFFLLLFSVFHVIFYKNFTSSCHCLLYFYMYLYYNYN